MTPGPRDHFPADGLCIEVVEFAVNQSGVNGESAAVAKDANDPFLFGGSYVAEGRGRMVVACVGAHSRQGLVWELLATADRQPTPVQVRLSRLAEQIVLMGLVAAAMTFGVLFIQWQWRQVRRGTFESRDLNEPLGAFIIAILVCAVPEGLPLAVALGYSMRRMTDDRNFVGHRSACGGWARAPCS